MKDLNTSIYNLTLTSNEDIVVNTRSKEVKPNFLMVGNGTMNKNKIKSIDLMKEMSLMSKPALYALLVIRDNLHWDNRTGVVPVNLSDKSLALKQKFKKGFKELKEKNLAINVRRGYYMINPNALIPLDYTKALAVWNSKGNLNLVD